MAMLPQTPFYPNRPPRKHEPINDLPVHPFTRNQLFVPTSESRAFTRADAAKAFHPKLLPADERIAHPELVQIAKWEFEGHDRETRQRMMREMDAEAAAARERKDRKQRQWEERTQVIVKGRRWDFKFQDITVSKEKTGKDGRGQTAVGYRYGMPLGGSEEGADQDTDQCGVDRAEPEVIHTSLWITVELCVYFEQSYLRLNHPSFPPTVEIQACACDRPTHAGPAYRQTARDFDRTFSHFSKHAHPLTLLLSTRGYVTATDNA